MKQNLTQLQYSPGQLGKISFRNLKRVAKELGENMTDEELQEMIGETTDYFEIFYKSIFAVEEFLRSILIDVTMS